MEYFAKSVPNGGSKEEQVTLKQHLDDTVKCAQDFFEKFGHYFTEKEKTYRGRVCDHEITSGRGGTHFR